ncbi:MAG: indolepyruvate oxidoreductase subunit beta [Clostridiales bacterium]|nr:indolepyruvate oxidoreductase subunit beta [Clostridiales bacterium]
MNKAKKEITDMLIVGVGGQGAILTSRVIGHVMQGKGLDVKISEIHGMAQRGGSVVSQVRFGECVHSPIIIPGTADIILAFERLEALRYLPWLKKGGVVIVNDQRIDPMPVITGNSAYPQGIVRKIEESGASVICVDALAKAREAGNAKSFNVVLLGLLSRHLGFEDELWLEALRQWVAPSLLEVNLAAFRAGKSLV